MPLWLTGLRGQENAQARNVRGISSLAKNVKDGAPGDMESTMRYLMPSRSQQTREKVNEIFA
jgi:hypothetical protein